MRRTVLLLLFCIFMTSVFSQQSASDLYVVHFNDKGLKKSAKVNPSIFLSDKAVERRLKQNISFDQSDIPVNEQYIIEILKRGARVITRSRWFNTIVIEADALAVKSIQALPFISEMQLISGITKQANTPVSEKQYFRSETVNPSTVINKKLTTNDLYNYGNAYNQINQLKGQSLHNMGFSGQGMTIAVIDAGFNSADIMTCFDSLRANHQVLGTRDFAQPGNNVYSTGMNSHGTMVLSCMAANSSGQMVGTAPKADYWLLRSEDAKTESIIEEYYWVSAAEFADSVGADLINSSLGYTTFDNPATNHTYADMDGNTTVVTRGADKAAEKGILVVNSAGNSGGAGWWYIGAPADGDSVFTIGAVNASGIRASFSSVGPTYDRRIKPTVAAQGSEAAVFAPGSNSAGILSSASGTSFSSPIICGISACLWQANPHLNNMQIIEAIKTTASQASQPDSLLGWGIPDYSQALIYLPVYSDAAGKTLLAYPNPVTDHVTIGFPLSIQGKYILQIINLQGTTVYSRQQDMVGAVRSFQIHDISDIPAGIYFIRVSNGLLSFSTRIVKI
jgi:serine protease AprX